MGHVSEKTDSYAMGVILLELLTGKLAGNPLTGELLATEMMPVVSNPHHLLVPHLDNKALSSAGSTGAVIVWQSAENKVALAQAISLAEIARSCLDPSPRTRTEVKNVLARLDTLAGRKDGRRATRGIEYDPLTGKPVPKAPKPLNLAITKPAADLTHV